jgi:hypothetical protein
VAKSVSQGLTGIEDYSIAILYDPESLQFIVTQTYPEREYRNTFAVSSDGEVTAYCDHFPNGPLIDAILKGKVPTSRKRFDLMFCTAPDPIEFVKTLAERTVQELNLRGILDENIDPSELKPRRSR